MNTIGNHKPKILVIDDNQAILFIMQKALELKNYTVEVTSSIENIQTIIKISPDLIFIDVSLPGKNGGEICRELKSNSVTKNIPIILLTGYSNAKELAKDAMADNYLLKPFGLVNLWKIASQYTKQS